MSTRTFNRKTMDCYLTKNQMKPICQLDVERTQANHGLTRVSKICSKRREEKLTTKIRDAVYASEKNNFNAFNALTETPRGIIENWLSCTQDEINNSNNKRKISVQISSNGASADQEADVRSRSLKHNSVHIRLASLNSIIIEEEQKPRE